MREKSKANDLRGDAELVTGGPKMMVWMYVGCGFTNYNGQEDRQASFVDGAMRRRRGRRRRR